MENGGISDPRSLGGDGGCMLYWFGNSGKRAVFVKHDLTEVVSAYWSVEQRWPQTHQQYVQERTAPPPCVSLSVGTTASVAIKMVACAN